MTCEVFITVTSSWMSPSASVEMYNFSKEVTASIFRTESDEFHRFHRKIGRFLSHFTSSLIRHYVTSNTHNSSVGRAIALVVRLWLPTRVFGSASVTHVRFAADHSSLEHMYPCQSLLHHCPLLIRHCVIVLTRCHIVTSFSWKLSG